MSDSILITGGLGFIGTRLASTLLKESPDLTLFILDKKKLDLVHSCASELLIRYKERIVLINKDIRDVSDFSFLSDVRSVVHLAANPGVQISIDTPLLDLQENLLNTILLLEQIRSHSSKTRFIFSSSAAPIAGCPNLPSSENDPIMPLSPYGASKASCEAYIKAYSSCFGIESFIFRFSNVYGPGSLDKGSVVARMIKDALDHSLITINGDGSQTRDFVYIDDLVDIVQASIYKSVSPHNPIHICSGTPSSIFEIASTISSLLSKKLDIQPEIVYAPPLVGDALENFSDPTYLNSFMSKKIRNISPDLLSSTIDYFSLHYKKS